MARRPVTDLVAWPALALEGSLIAPAMLALVAREKADDQRPEDYKLRKGLALRDEISLAFRAGQAHWRDLARRPNAGPQATARFVESLLREAFGFDDIAPAAAPLAFAAGNGRAPVVVVPPSDALDRRSPALSSDRPRSAALALQDHLNANDDALWGLASNGALLRLMRDNASLTRPEYLDADLGRIFGDEDVASFALLWLLVHRSRFGRAGPPAHCPLERWRETGAREGIAARDRLAGQVTEALAILGSGFLAADPGLRARVWAADDARLGFFNELLRLVYRLIFLMVTEDRDLLHPPGSDLPARHLYETGYSLTRLRALARRRSAWDRHNDRYEGLKIVFHALACGEPRLALPALGGLFDPVAMPTLTSATLPNRALMEAVWHLAYLREGAAMAPVNWRAMESEELGSVYESLLELQPQAGDGGRSLIFAGDAAEQAGNQRRNTSSYYTPDSLVQVLLDSALDPLLERAESSEDPEKALLDLRVIDPACGSGHFLLAAARRIAARLARLRMNETPSAEDYRHTLRDVVRTCVRGVDRNPMAVELAKVALWIETVDPGKPLGFLDPLVHCGDALVGVYDLGALKAGIPDAAYTPLDEDDRAVANHYKAKNRREIAERERVEGGFGFNRQKDLARQLTDLAAMPEETVELITEKRARFDAIMQDGASAWALERACDLWTSTFFALKKQDCQFAGPDGLPRRGTETIATSGTVWELLRGREPFDPLTAAAAELASHHRFFHWPIAFADVLARGGFDLVLGNPPWKPMSPDYKEFFSVYDPAIRFMSPADQKAAFATLLENPSTAERWDEYCRDLYTSVHFMKSSGRYRLFAPGNLGKGDFNVYRMFVETALGATRTGCATAQFVPEGLYNGANATAIRQEIFTKFRLEKLAGFENSKGIWFPSIDTRARFCLYVARKGDRTESFDAAFRVNSLERLRDFGEGRTLNIPVAIVHEFSPDAHAVMEFSAQEEIDICAKMYARYPKFGEEIEGPPYRRYMAEVHMGSNRDLFYGGQEGVPVFEGRMVDAYDYRAKGYASGRGRSAEWNDLPFGSSLKQVLPQWRILPENIPDKLSGRIDQYRIGFCDVASPTNSRSLIAALIPPNTVCGDKVPTIAFGTGAKDLLLWLGVANSLVLDFVVRKKVSLKMSYTIMDSLPFPRDFKKVPDADQIARRVCALCAVGPEMAAFREAAADDGILDSELDTIEDPEQRAVVAAEIDALVARSVYGLNKRELLYILDPDNILGKDFGIETFKALRNREWREFGEFRTQRLVCEAWERLEGGQAIRTSNP